MEIRQLKYFVSIAESGSFSNASRRHFLSQSAISQQIKALEDELKTTLFVRTSHRVELTESGHMLLPLARQVLQSVNECTERMSDVHNLLCGELNIGLTHSLEPYIRKTLSRFMQIYPKVHLNVYYKTISEMIAMLRENHLDFAFSIKVEGEEDWVESIPMLSYQLCAFMRDTHPLANKQMLTFKDLERQALVLPEQALRSNNAVEDFLSKEGAELQIRAFINDPGAIINLLKHTNCVSILSKQTERDLEEICAIPIKELLTPVVAYAHIPKTGHRKRSANEFLSILKEVIK